MTGARPALARPSYRVVVRSAFIAAAGALFLFGLAHAAFITWMVDRSKDPSLLARLAIMFAAPVGVGIPFAILAAIVGASAWRATRERGRLRSWRYGAALASALIPPIALSLAHGPFGDALPGPVALVALLTCALALPAAIGVWATRRIFGLLVGAAALPFAVPWTVFILGEGIVRWVIPFVVSMVAILLATGWAMERFAATASSEAFSPEPSSV